MTPQLLAEWGIALTVGALAAFAILAVLAMATDRRHRAPAPECECDCVTFPSEPRPQCPWCDTRECLDSTLCNCAGPCGNWLCVDKETAR